MAQLLRRRHRGRSPPPTPGSGQPKRPSPLSSPPPTPGGDHQPTSLFRRPDLILLPDGRRISIYESSHGVLVTDAIDGSARPVEDVFMDVLYDLWLSPYDNPHTPDSIRPYRCVLPDKRIIRVFKDNPHPPDSNRPYLSVLPDKRIIRVYKDNRIGDFVTDDVDGPRRRVEDVCREVINDLQKRPRDPPPPMANPIRPGGHRHPYRPRLIFCILPDDRITYACVSMDEILVTEDLEGFTRPVQDVFRETLYDLWTRPRDPPPPVDATEEDQPAPQQTATPSPGPSGAQFVDDHKLKLAQRCEDREQNVLALKELLDTTTLESITNASSPPQPTPHEDGEPNVLASKELLDATTLEESSITNSLPQPTSPLKEELFLTPQLLQGLDKGRASFELWRTQQPSGSGHACHYLALQGPDMLSSEDIKATLGKSSIMEASSTRAEVVTHSLTSPISARKPAGWNHQFFIRVDLGGVFHTYPKLGGPFRSLDEAEKAILCRLDELRDPKMCTNDGLSNSEIAIRDALHWPDGTRKYSSRSNPDKDHVGLLVQALLDKYNEENKLLGDDSYHVEGVVSFQEVYEGKGGWYYHLNCTRKTKRGVDNLFFAEVLKTIRGPLDEFELTCLLMIEPAVDNGPCYCCARNNLGMKHPIDAGKYKGGHDPSWPRRCRIFPLGPPDLPEGFEAQVKFHEERIRYLYGDRDVVKSYAGRTDAADGLEKRQLGRRGFQASHARMNEERITYTYGDRVVAKSYAGRTAAADGLDKSQLGRRGFPSSHARMNEERTRYTYGDRNVAKFYAGMTAAGLEGKRGKYVVPAMRQKV